MFLVFIDNFLVLLVLVELQQMMEKENLCLENVENARYTQPWLCDEFSEVTPELCSHIGSGSGGYADQIFKYAAYELFGITVNKVEYRQLRFSLLFLRFFNSK